MTYDLFVSYARIDDASGRVAALIGRIADRYRSVSGGSELRIFLDEAAIPSMADWDARISSALSETKLFLAVLTPDYLNSTYCKYEWQEYVRREAARQYLGEGIAPVHLTDIGEIESAPPNDDTQEWLCEMRKRQWSDLRSWQIDEKTDSDEEHTDQRIDELCEQLLERLSRAVKAAASPTNLYQHNPHFVGRTQELTQLRTALASKGNVGLLTPGGSDATPSAPAAVHGIGGLGKTELALAYAHSFAWDYPGGRWLARCEDETDFDLALAQLAGPMGLQLTEDEQRDPQQGAERVLAHMREAGRTLLVLDNVTHGELLAPGNTMRLPGSTRVHVVATTRLGPAQIGGSTHQYSFIAVDELPLDDAIALLRSHQPEYRFPGDDAADAARELAELLDGFTLAVETAAIYLGRHPGRDTIRQYLDRLQETLVAASEAVAADEVVAVRHREKLLANTLQITLDSLEPVEAQILLLAALMPADQVAIPWINQLLAEQYPEYLNRPIPGIRNAWREAMETLFSMRLLQRTPVEDRIGQILIGRIHRLVQGVVVDRSDAGDVGSWQVELQRLTGTKAQRIRTEWVNDGARWQLSPLVAFATEHLTDGDETAGVRLVEQLHDALWQLGRLTECRNLLERAWRASADEPEVALGLSGAVSRMYRSLGEPELAIEVMERGLEIAGDIPGDQWRARAGALNNLGRLKLDRGKRAEAEQNFREAMELVEQNPSSLPVDKAWLPHFVPRLMFNQASLAFARNDFERSRELLKRRTEYIDNASRTEGDIVDDLDADRLEAQTYGAEGDFKRERKILESTVAKADAVFSEPQIMRALLRSDLANVELQAGNGEKAGPLLEEALDLMEQVLGPDHLRVAEVLLRLSLVHDQRQEWGRSLQLHRRRIGILEENLGPDHAELLPHLKTLALLEAGVGDDDNARNLLNRVIDGALAQPEIQDNEAVYDSFRAMGAVVSKMGDYVGYSETLNRGAAFIVAAFGPQDHRLDEFALKLFQVGVYLIGNGERELGEERARAGMRFFQGAGAPAKVLANCQAVLSQALGEEVEEDERLEAGMKATSSQEARYNAYETANRLASKGVEMYSRNRMDEALAAFDQSAHLFDILSADQPDDEELAYRSASAHNNAGNVKMAFKEFQRAREEFIHATDVFGKLWQQNPERPDFGKDFAAALNNIGTVISYSDKPEGAEQFFLESLKIRDDVEGRHPDYDQLLEGRLNTMHSLASLYNQLGKKGEAEAILKEAIELEMLSQLKSEGTLPGAKDK